MPERDDVKKKPQPLMVALAGKHKHRLITIDEMSRASASFHGALSLQSALFCYVLIFLFFFSVLFLKTLLVCSSATPFPLLFGLRDISLLGMRVSAIYEGDATPYPGVSTHSVRAQLHRMRGSTSVQNRRTCGRWRTFVRSHPDSLVPGREAIVHPS